MISFPPQRALLPGGRWHFQHGPIDIIIGATGDRAALEAAHEQAWQRFQSILSELVAELPALRCRVQGACPVVGATACRMWSACQPYQSSFITPMAAVAGAVAQELLSSYQVAGIHRAWVNNGGDIAFHLARRQSLRVGLYANLERFDGQQLENGLSLDGQIDIHSASPVRGIATSGWRGRSFSLGIADSVTVLARTAAEADAAATVIANAVNTRDAHIIRRPANDMKDNSDLGDLLVTVDVPRLKAEQIDMALASGLVRALELRSRGLIQSAFLVCQNRVMTTERSITHLAYLHSDQMAAEAA